MLFFGLIIAAIFMWLVVRVRRQHHAMEEASQMAVYDVDYMKAMEIKRKSIDCYKRNLFLLPPERASQSDMEAMIYLAAAAIDRMNALDGIEHGRQYRTAIRQQLLMNLHAEANKAL
jgi:hypothetical protein